MIDDEILQSSASLISKDFGLEPFEETELNEQLLLEHLCQVVQYLLDNDLNKLLNILYRIDINEDDVKSILTTIPPNEMSPTLSKKIIERVYRKAETRLRYRS